jgi:hypothetical protein
MSRWKYIREGTEYFYNVGIEADGSLYNPNGYPAEQVRALVLAAEGRKRAKRSSAIKKAVATRQRLRATRAHEAALEFAKGNSLGPRIRCALCRHPLSDKESISRGIGSECWQGILDEMAEIGEREPGYRS